VNTIVLAGRADLCALARPHIYDPHWTLHAAAEQGYADLEWVPQYRAGSRRPPRGRDVAESKELERTFESAPVAGAIAGSSPTRP
jgi:anthraniloyl-CoA monooxygenase